MHMVIVNLLHTKKIKIKANEFHLHHLEEKKLFPGILTIYELILRELCHISLKNLIKTKNQFPFTSLFMV